MGSSSLLAGIADAFREHCDDGPEPYEVVNVGVVEDDETGDSVLAVVLTIPKSFAEQLNEVPIRTIVPTVYSYSTLVRDASFPLPVDVTIAIRSSNGRPAYSVVGYRIAHEWMADHVAGDMSLEQLGAAIAQTITAPESGAAIRAGWVPTYDADWRDQDVPDAEEFGHSVDFEYWSEGRVPYPPEDE